MSNIMRLLSILKDDNQCQIRFGQKLKRWRDSLGMTEEEFAKRCGLSRQSIVKYELHPEEFKKGISLKRIETFLMVFSEKFQCKISPEEFLKDIVYI